MLLPIAFVLLSSFVSFGSPCCAEKERISAFIDGAMDLLSKAKSIHISCPTDSGGDDDDDDDNSQNERPKDCEDLYKKGSNKNGVYTIYPVNKMTSTKSLRVYCDMENGGWTVIQRRGDFGSADDFFYQNWESYKNGFGDIEKDFWLGNDNIFAITNQGKYSVYFAIEDKEGDKAYAQYDNFRIDDESNSYALEISGYRGTAGDSMAYHNNMKFSTSDRDNDEWTGHCAVRYKSGWWFNNCSRANLNSLYNNETDGIYWYDWKNKYVYFPRAEIKVKSSA